MDNQCAKSSWYQRVDTITFGISASIIGLFFLWALAAGENMGVVMSKLFNLLTNQLGSFYLIFGFLFIIFAAWLAFGPYGNIKLGKDSDVPEYSFFSWFAMLFACGYGIGLVFWGAAEPLSFLSSPPLGVEAGTSRAGEIALSYAFFHWGWTPWAMYLGCTVPIGYFMYRKGLAPRFSSCLKPIFGRHTEGTGGKVLDSIMVFGTVGGLATSLGLGIKTLAAGVEKVLGIPQSNVLFLVIAVIWIAVFTTSAVSGIDKGIKRLSDINIPLAMVLMLFVFVTGPSAFQINLGTNAFGDYLTNFLRMSFWTDPIDNGGFPQGWTIFYWAWWFACAPATGFFIAKISKGRTIRQVVGAHMLLAPVATWLWFTTFGGSAIFYELKEKVGLVATLNEQGSGAVIYHLLEQLPLSGIVSAAFLVLIILFLSTTADSFAYVCAQVTTKEECDPQNPPKGIRAFWAITIGVVAIVLLMFGNGISGLQLSSIIASFFIVIVEVIMCYSLFKSLQREKIVSYEQAKENVPFHEGNNHSKTF